MNDQNKEHISIREASRITGIGPQTLRRLADENKIKCYKTMSGQRKFDKNYLEQMCSSLSVDEQVPYNQKQNFIYARVSSKKQNDDLGRQIEFIQNRRPEYSSYTLVTDIGSGINFGRKGLSKILDSCLQGNVGEIVVAHKDRLSRFGFDLINLIVSKAGGRITILDSEKNKSTEQELSEDLLSIVHIYCCKQMGKRSYKRNNSDKINEDKTKVVS
jgi:putative resolvase